MPKSLCTASRWNRRGWTFWPAVVLVADVFWDGVDAEGMYLRVETRVIAALHVCWLW